jgi:UDP-glucose 4-epimerase
LFQNLFAGQRTSAKDFQDNVRGSLNLMDAMLDVGLDKIVFSSTCATYGVPDLLPISEAHPQRPINPYGESKLFVERALSWYAKAGFSMSSLARLVVLRIVLPVIAVVGTSPNCQLAVVLSISV